MRIDLEKPFSDRWSKGYLVTNKESRKHVVLYNSKEDRTTIPYARYLVSVREGRFLEPHEHVDHVDNDKTNDSLNNLEILTPEENRKKYQNWYRDNKQAMHNLVCASCGRDYEVTDRVYKSKNYAEKSRTYCSKPCVHIGLRKRQTP